MVLHLQSGLQRLRDFPQAFWLALFVEGTRFTQAKLLAAQEYAASTGLPVPRNVLIPRTKVKNFIAPLIRIEDDVPSPLLCSFLFSVKFLVYPYVKHLMLLSASS